QAEDGIRDGHVTGVQTCALPISQTIDLPLPMSGYETLGGGYLWVIVGGHGRLPGDDRFALVDLSTNHVASVKRLDESATAIAFEIGRASCRERVEDAGGAGGFRH